MAKVEFDTDDAYIAIFDAKGYMRDLGDDVFERVDEQGKVIGVAIFNFSKRDQQTTAVFK